jgi:hypothetical protein
MIQIIRRFRRIPGLKISVSVIQTVQVYYFIVHNDEDNVRG